MVLKKKTHTHTHTTTTTKTKRLKINYLNFENKLWATLS